MKPKPVRGIENLDPNKQYFEVGVLNPNCMWIRDPFWTTGKPFVPLFFQKTGNNASFFVPIDKRGRYGDSISLRDHFVIGECPYNNNRLFEYTPEAYALLKDIVARRAFEEYRELIGSTYPARYPNFFDSLFGL